MSVHRAHEAESAHAAYTEQTASSSDSSKVEVPVWPEEPTKADVATEVDITVEETLENAEAATVGAVEVATTEVKTVDAEIVEDEKK